MLSRTRTSTTARVALWTALCLSILASFGMHPEPPAESSRLAGPEIAAAKSAAAAAHECIACVSGGSALLSTRGAVVLDSILCSAATLPSAPLLFPRLAGRDLSGRSPPALS
jgi:hypothetical protein